MKPISTIGVVGAGNMGSGIAQKLAQEGLNVIIVDMKEEFVRRGIENIRSILDQGIDRKLFTPEQVNQTLSRIQGTTDLNAVSNADFVVEVIFEDEGVKKDLFRRLDTICSDSTILATNTSSFRVGELAKATSRRDRFVGMHYFYHPAKNRLLEVIPCAETSSHTLDRALELARLHGKTAIVVKDSPGFAVNRFFVPLLTESVKLLEEGAANIPTIEEAAKQAFQIGMGPFELMNVTGIPIAVHASSTFGRELGSFYDTPRLLREQMEKGELWELSGVPDPSRLEAIQDRLYGACLGAAAALVSEGVATVEDTDRGAKVGLRWRRGPFEIMNRITVKKSFRVVEAICERNSDFAMPEILARQAGLGKPFQFTFVDLSVRDGIGFITINRPEAMNALNEITVAQLDEAFTKAEQDPAVRAIVLRGAGKAFVAGADIRYFVENIKRGRIEDTRAFTRRGHDLLLRIENSEKLTIALLDGLSLGGGSELALACQAIVATPAGSMGFPETSIGIYPGLGGMIRLARHVGPELAKYYVFTGETLTAGDAFELEIVTELVPPQDLDTAIRGLCSAGKPDKYRPRAIPPRFLERARTCSPENVPALLNGGDLAGVEAAVAETTYRSVSRKAPLALRKVDELIDRQQSLSIPEAIEVELDGLTGIFSTEDALTGLTSVGGKRAEFRGK